MLIACSLLVLAADISGKWVAQIPGRQGATTEWTFNFKVEGNKLTGTISSQRGEQQISEGTVSGDTVQFTVVRQGGQGEIKEVYKGTVAGNEIKFTRTREGGGGRGATGPVEFVAKRAS